jgi:AcrR family transcriptional regulator
LLTFEEAPMNRFDARRQPQQSRAQATVEAVLEATAQVLFSDGWEALSTNRIAKHAGVSVGSLYQYFPNKQAIVRELMSRYSEQQYQELARGLAKMRAGASFEEAIEEVLGAILAVKLNSPALMRACFEQLPPAEQVILLGDWSRLVVPLVEVALAAEGLVKPPRDLRLVSFMIIHAIDGILHSSALLDPSISTHRDFHQECLRMILGFLRDDRADVIAR